jgi:hypothetical protein
MEPRITFIGLGVSDLKQATQFYRDGLHLPLRKESNDEITFFDMNGIWLSLYPRDLLAADANVPAEGGGFSGVTLAHNVRSREAVDAGLQEAGAAGATITKPAKATDWGGYSGYFADPDGHLWEIAWNPHIEV